MIAGQPLADEDSRKVFPSFVWLLRDVLLSLPKGVENLRTYFLEKVTIAHARNLRVTSAIHIVPCNFNLLSGVLFVFSLLRHRRGERNDHRLRAAKTYGVVTMRTRIIPLGMKFSWNLIFANFADFSSIREN